MHMIPDQTGVGEYFYIIYTVDLPADDTLRPWVKVIDQSDLDVDAEMLMIKYEDIDIFKYYLEEVFSKSQAEFHPKISLNSSQN